MTFCWSFSFPAASFPCSVTCRPYSKTLVNEGDASSSWRTALPVAPVAPRMSAERPTHTRPRSQDARRTQDRVPVTSHLRPLRLSVVILVRGKLIRPQETAGQGAYIAPHPRQSRRLGTAGGRYIICSAVSLHCSHQTSEGIILTVAGRTMLEPPRELLG